MASLPLLFVALLPFAVDRHVLPGVLYTAVLPPSTHLPGACPSSFPAVSVVAGSRRDRGPPPTGTEARKLRRSGTCRRCRRSTARTGSRRPRADRTEDDAGVQRRAG